MKLRTISLPHLLAGAVSCVMAGVVALEAVPLGDDPTIASDTPIAARKPDASRAAVDATALVKVALERPLFTPGRQAAEEPDEEGDDEEDDEAPLPLEARLAGVFIGPDHSEALFDKDGEEPVAVPEGGEIDGWTVDSIEMDRVVLSSASGEKTLLPTPVDPAAVNARRAAAIAKKRALVNQGRPAAAAQPARSLPPKPSATPRPKAAAQKPALRSPAVPASTGKAAASPFAKPAVPVTNARPTLSVNGRTAPQFAAGRTTSGREP
jgi:hypothetical protein